MLFYYSFYKQVPSQLKAKLYHEVTHDECLLTNVHYYNFDAQLP